MDIRSIGINSIHNGSYKVDREAADNEFMLILMKSRGIFTLNGAEEIAEKGMAVILDGSERICYRADESVFIYDWIVFDGRADSDITAEMPVNKLICHTDQEYLSGIIRNIGIEFYSLNPRRGKNNRIADEDAAFEVKREPNVFAECSAEYRSPLQRACGTERKNLQKSSAKMERGYNGVRSKHEPIIFSAHLP